MPRQWIVNCQHDVEHRQVTRRCVRVVVAFLTENARAVRERKLCEPDRVNSRCAAAEPEGFARALASTAGKTESTSVDDSSSRAI